jgi:serine protease Do
MDNKKGFWRIGSVVMALVLVSAIAIGAYAAGSISTADIDALLNTTTDKTQISSPFLGVANDVRNSVVGVNNYQTSWMPRGSLYGFRYFGDSEGSERLRGTGSGVVISSYGHVLTNYHVIENASRVTVTYGTKEAEAQIVATSEELDVAVLQVPGLDLKPVTLGDSDQLQVGEWAIVVGNPLGQEFDRSVTVGVVSAFNREISGNTVDRYGRRNTVTRQMIQVDAAISSGNSGGGMFNMLGQLQGIPTLKYDSNFFSQTSIDNIGMCLPINAAKPLIREALEKYDAKNVGTPSITDNGKASDSAASATDSTKPRIGVQVATLNPASPFMIQGILPKGAYVSKVESGSPAEAAGLKEGDIIVESAGTIVDSSTALVDQLAGYKAGDKVELKYFRAEGLADIVNGKADADTLGEGAYATVTVELKVLGDNKL